MPVIDEAPAKTETEYRGPHIHVKIPPQVSQPTAQYLYQGFQSVNSGMPPTYLGESPANVVPKHTHFEEPYALYVHLRVHYSQTTNSGTQMVNPGMTYPQWLP